MEYKGDLKGFPKEVVERMLDCQVEQGNIRDVGVFEKEQSTSKNGGGFDWNESKEETSGDEFWSEVISERNFDLFFEKYPRTGTIPTNNYKGKLAKYPIEIAELMFTRTMEYNSYNRSRAINHLTEKGLMVGFAWDCSPEGHRFGTV